MTDLSKLVDGAFTELRQVKDIAALEQYRIKYLGRKGLVSGILRGIKDLPELERIQVGAAANDAKFKIENAVSDLQRRLENLERKIIDTTLPAIKPHLGHQHLISAGIEDILRIFEEIGFVRRRHPEIESDWFAFTALNVPPGSPARDDWETFFVDFDNGTPERYLLTPQSTSGTARALATEKPPIRNINIQKTYRRQIDATHLPMFHQFDGVYVDTDVTIQHLKGIFKYFIKAFFGENREIRLRPHHFGFTEPSIELDISCAVCNGKSCKLCKQGWVELGGAGMLHPNVLKAAKLNPDKVNGLAFGFGIERTILMRAGLDIPDLRLIYENDLRFLEQF